LLLNSLKQIYYKINYHTKNKTIKKKSKQMEHIEGKKKKQKNYI